MITSKNYHLDTTHVSKSGLDLINKAPALYHQRYLSNENIVDNSSEAFLLGGGFHTLVLEPHLLKEEYVSMPLFKDDVKKRQKAFKESNPGKKIISFNAYRAIEGMKNSVLNHPIAKKLLANGQAELPFTWIDPISDVACKCKPDFLKDSTTIVDLKSTEDASEKAFRRSSLKFRYDVQSAFYTDGLIENGYNIKNFIFIAVEKKPPYLVNIFLADSQTISVGREKYEKDLEAYSECLFNDEWPGYTTEIKPLEIEY